MDRLMRMLSSILKRSRRRKQWRVLSTALAGIVVFVTTYSFILPAITLEERAAAGTPGIYLNTGEGIEEEAWFEDEAAGGIDAEDDFDWYDEAADDDFEDDEYSYDDVGEEGVDGSGGAAGGEDGKGPEGDSDADRLSPAADVIADDVEDSFIEEAGSEGSFGPLSELTCELPDEQGRADVVVRLTFGPEEDIPAETELHITEISRTAEEAAELYRRDLAASEEALGEAYPGSTISRARFFDLSLAAAGEKVEPTAEVGVEMTFAEPLRAERVAVLRFAEGRREQEEQQSVSIPCVLDGIQYSYNEDGDVVGAAFRTERLGVLGVAEVMAAEEQGNYPAQSFTASTEDVRVQVFAEEGAFPEGTAMTVSAVEDEDTISAISEAAEEDENKVRKIHAVEITFLDAAGNEIEPRKPVRVEMTSEEIGENEKAVVVHVDDDGNAEALEDVEVVSRDDSAFAEVTEEGEHSVSGEDGGVAVDGQDGSGEAGEEEPDSETEAAFDADEFSIYAIVYTVDFHWEVNGKQYNFSIPGGGYASFTELVEILKIAGSGAQDAYEDRIPEDDVESGNPEITEQAVADDDAQTLGEVEISGAARAFVADVENITFSTPSLLSVSKAGNDTTVGGIKDALGLACEYSAGLTAEQIEEINSIAVSAGDWALISLKPFDTSESLAVTMKNGDVFEILVTDAKPTQVTNLDTSGLDNTFTVNLFNYGPSSSLDKAANGITGSGSESDVQSGINGYSALDFMAYGTKGSGINHFTGDSTIRQGIVKGLLNDNEYPTLTGGGDLDYLFDSDSIDGGVKDVYENVTGLFYKSDVNGNATSSGRYYSYDSDKYYAYLDKGSNKIEFYQTYKMDGGDSSVEKDGMQNNAIGFFPFTVPDTSQKCPHPDDIHWWGNHPNGHGGRDSAYSPWDSKYYGSGYYDHQFGLSLSGTFQIPEGGKVDNDNMIFSFSGDDDMWVFIDDVLVLDIGGIHHPSSGYIDFSANNGDGLVHVDNSVLTAPGGTAINTNGNATIKSLFEAAGKTWDSSDYSAHTIKVFYLERGGIYSNCKITFNIPLVPVGNLSFNKSGSNDQGITGKILEHIPGAEFQLFLDAACTEPFTRGGQNVTAIADGSGTVTFTQIPTEPKQGFYYMKEIKAPAGYEISDKTYCVKYVVEGYNTFRVYSVPINPATGQPVTDESQWVNTNDIRNEWAYPIDFSLTKTWSGGTSGSAPDNASATFKLMRKSTRAGKAEEAVKVAYDSVNQVYKESTGGNETFTLNAAAGWTARFKGLSKVDDYGYPYHYYFVETGSTPGGYVYSFKDGYGDADNPIDADAPQNVTVNNYKNEVYVEKRWYGADGELLDPQPADTVSVTLSALDGSSIADAARNITAQERGVWTVEDDADKLYTAAENQVPDGFLVSYSFRDSGEESERAEGGVHRGGTIYVNNRKNVGSLEITKAVTVNGAADTTSLTDGTYQFSVVGPSGAAAGTSHVVAITFANGKAVSYQIDAGDVVSVTGTDNTYTVLLENLAPGDYVITETDSGSLTLAGLTGGKSGTASVKNKSVTVTVTGGKTAPAELEDTAKASFTNNCSIFEVIIEKVDTGETSTKLGGAVFDLYAESSVENGKIKSGETPLKSNLTTSDQEADKGKVSLGSLKPGTYYLVETTAPAGYVLPDAPIRIIVYEDRVGWTQGASEKAVTIEQNKAELTVMNSAGVALPNTGGPGTDALYLFGGIMAALAGMLLLLKRRGIRAS